MHALWIFIFKPPTPSAPKTTTPSRSTPLSCTSMPSTPCGGTALRSAATRSGARHHADAGGAGADEQCGAIEHLHGLRGVAHRDGADRSAEPLLQRLEER